MSQRPIPLNHISDLKNSESSILTVSKDSQYAAASITGSVAIFDIELHKKEIFNTRIHESTTKLKSLLIVKLIR